MALYDALDVSLEEDLLPLSALLHERGLPHRVIENNGRQVLQVADEQHVATVAALYGEWRTGAIDIQLQPRASRGAASSAPAAWLTAPVTLALVATSVIVFILAFLLNWVELQVLLHFLPITQENGQFVQTQMGMQYWRLVTPAFLHFSWLHIVFNCLWLWDLGRRVELSIGHFNMFMLFLFIAATSNVCQAVYGNYGLFGGMSGVVYGLLAFSWVAPLLQPAWRIQPTKPIMIMMLVWLVLCMSGVIGGIANAAHVSGLILGALLGAIFGSLSRFAGKATGTGLQ